MYLNDSGFGLIYHVLSLGLEARVLGLASDYDIVCLTPTTPPLIPFDNVTHGRPDTLTYMFTASFCILVYYGALYRCIML